MKQRLALARTLLHDPPLLFLDEPTAGLDPEAARQVTGLIEELARREGRTVLLCTHNLDEAQRLCDRVAVMGRGKVLANGTLEELARTLWQGIWVDVEVGGAVDPAAAAKARAMDGVFQVQVTDSCISAQLQAQDRIPTLVALLAAQGVPIFRVNPRKYTLEDIYFRLQGEGKEAEA
jgi:ABC-2 type transport system ATP-binding protein